MNTPIKKKKPSDYPIFAFRVEAQNKEDLMAMVKKVVRIRNKRVKEDEKIIRKNDVILEALASGLRAMMEK
ncbi:hypothetical protein WDW86_05705 [Bdellovibrionota bacterium FG-2]